MKSNVSSSQKPVQWQLGTQTLARIFCRDGAVMMHREQKCAVIHTHQQPGNRPLSWYVTTGSRLETIPHKTHIILMRLKAKTYKLCIPTKK